VVPGEEVVMRGDPRHAQSRPRRATRRRATAPGPAGDRRGPAAPAAPAEAEDLARLLEPLIGAAGLDLESVRVKSAGRRLLVQVVVDADGGVSLDEIADLSRDLTPRLDAALGDAPYTLEVSSPGVDRPLTQPRHWRRARGRLVSVPLADSSQSHFPGITAPAAPASTVQGRVIVAGDNGVTLEIDGQPHRFSYAELGPGRVQVEFGKLAGGDEADGEEPLADGGGDAAAAARPRKGGSPDGH
jgi:ribosome maturation factor RimP